MKHRPRSKPIPNGVKVDKIPLEKHSEAKLKREISKLGGLCYKFSTPQRRGVSDRVVMIYGKVFFVEMKRVGITRPARTQDIFRKEVTTQNQYYCIVSGHDGVDNFIKFITKNKNIFTRISMYTKLLLGHNQKLKVFK